MKPINHKLDNLKNRSGILRLHFIYLKTRLRQNDFEYVLEQIVDKMNEIIDYIEDLEVDRENEL